MRHAQLQQEAQARWLTILGGFHPVPEDAAPDGCRTMLLLGPDEPHFWPHLTAAPEWQDRQPDPVDRWSLRVIGAWARTLDATALFPFGGPPYLPFFSWALRSGRIHASPIRLLVHDTAGLFVSFRGALALAEHIELPAPPPSPCQTCADQPCRTSCPVAALDGTRYDVDGCTTFLDSVEGADCMRAGCKVRRSCPVSRRFGRLPAQSAYHMTSFKG